MSGFKHNPFVKSVISSPMSAIVICTLFKVAQGLTFVNFQTIIMSMLNFKSKSNASLIFIFITIFIDAIGIGLVSPILPDVIRKFGSSEEFVTTYFGYFISIYALMLFIASPLLGALADRFGRRPVLLVALCGAGLDYILMAYAPNLTILFIGRIFAGLTGASLTVAMSYIADISDDTNRTQNFGMIGAAFGLGFIVGPAIGGIVGSYGHHYPFLVAAAMSLTNFLFGLFILPESLPKEKRPTTINLKKLNPLKTVFFALFKSPKLALIWTFFLLQLAGQSYPSTWALYTHHKFSWTTIQIGLSLTFVGIAVSLGQGFTIRLMAPRLGERKSILYGIILLAINYIFFAISSTEWMVYGSIAMILLTSIAIPSIQASISNGVPDYDQGKLQGSLVALMSLSSIIGPLLYTNLFSYFTNKNHYDFPGAPYIASSLVCLVALSIVIRKYSVRELQSSLN